MRNSSERVSSIARPRTTPIFSTDRALVSLSGVYLPPPCATALSSLLRGKTGLSPRALHHRASADLLSILAKMALMSGAVSITLNSETHDRASGIVMLSSHSSGDSDTSAGTNGVPSMSSNSSGNMPSPLCKALMMCSGLRMAGP